MSIRPRDVFDRVIADHTPRLPTRTATQLRALHDDIQARTPSPDSRIKIPKLKYETIVVVEPLV